MPVFVAKSPCQTSKNQVSGVPDVLSDRLLETRNRKPLRPNEIANWELRLGKFRVFYNVEEEVLIVSIEAIGFKVGNLLFVRGVRRLL